MQTLDELGYEVADAAHTGADDPKVIDGRHFYLSTGNALCWWVFGVTSLHEGFTPRDIATLYPPFARLSASCWNPPLMTNLSSPECCGNISIAMRASIRSEGTALTKGLLTQRIAQRGAYAVCPLLQRWCGDPYRSRLGSAFRRKVF